MLVDDRNEFCGPTALTGITAASNGVVVGDVIDRQGLGGGAADSDVLDLGGGQPVYLVAVVTTAITATDADSVTITLRSHEDEDLETGGTPKDHLSVTFAVNTTSAGLATAGSVLFKTALPVDESYQRYIGIYGDIAGSEDVDAGAINAFLTRDPAAWRPLKDAVQ